MKAVVAAFNQEKALVGAFSVITNLRMELFEALEKSEQGTLNSVCCNYDVVRCSAERESCPGAKHDLPREQGEGPRQGRGVQAEEWAAQATVLHRNTGQYG